MAYRTDSEISDPQEGRQSPDALPPAAFAAYPKHIGGLEIRRDGAALQFRRENAGGLGWEAYIFFGIAMLAVTLLGLLSVVHNGNEGGGMNAAESANMSLPVQNHFAVLWVLGIVALLGGVPFYVKKAYRAAHVFTWNKLTDTFGENDRRIASLKRIEYVTIREAKDPDSRYLYLLLVVHTDGHEQMVFNGYDEREVMTLASEIAGFCACRTRFTTTKG